MSRGRNRFHGQVAMDCLQLFQIDSILRSSGKALEADNAGQRGDPDHLALGDVSPVEFESLYVAQGVQLSNPS